jgi:hypothetical protein
LLEFARRRLEQLVLHQLYAAAEVGFVARSLRRRVRRFRLISAER